MVTVSFVHGSPTLIIGNTTINYFFIFFKKINLSSSDRLQQFFDNILPTVVAQWLFCDLFYPGTSSADCFYTNSLIKKLTVVAQIVIFRSLLFGEYVTTFIYRAHPDHPTCQCQGPQVAPLLM
jgi:hypothetical protein